MINTIRRTRVKGYRAVALLLLCVGLPQARGGIIGFDLIGVEEPTGNIYSVPTSPSPGGSLGLTQIGSTGVANLASLELAPDGRLFGFTSGSTPALFRIDPDNSFSATQVGTGFTNGFVFEGGIAFSGNGTAFGVGQGTQIEPQLFQVDVDTGTAQNVTLLDTSISIKGFDLNGLGWLADEQVLVGLDRITNSLIRIDPTSGATSILAQLTPTVGISGGLVVVDNVIFFATAGPGAPLAPGSNELWAFDRLAGASTRIGDFDNTFSGTGLSGLAVVPEPATISMLTAGVIGLLCRKRRRANVSAEACR